MGSEAGIETVCGRIISAFRPRRAILFSVKHSPSGSAKSFKLCLVIDTPDKAAAEKEIYLQIESDIPYDIILYTPSEWETLLGEKGSFAGIIEREGRLLYGTGESKGRGE